MGILALKQWEQQQHQKWRRRRRDLFKIIRIPKIGAPPQKKWKQCKKGRGATWGRVQWIHRGVSMKQNDTDEFLMGKRKHTKLLVPEIQCLQWGKKLQLWGNGSRCSSCYLWKTHGDTKLTPASLNNVSKEGGWVTQELAVTVYSFTYWGQHKTNKPGFNNKRKTTHQTIQWRPS